MEGGSGSARGSGHAAQGKQACDTSGDKGSGEVPRYAHWVPIVEVCDEDYRSFCWPCHAMDEQQDSSSE